MLGVRVEIFFIFIKLSEINRHFMYEIIIREKYDIIV